MPLKLRPTGLSSGIDQDRADYTVFCGEWNIARIYEVRSGSEHLRWFWALHFPSKWSRLKRQRWSFKASWRQWLAWAELSEMEQSDEAAN
jgi:hypothetical protein